LETVVGWPACGATGVFFEAQTPEALMAAVRLFEDYEAKFSPEACRRNAERFGRECFRQAFQDTIEELWDQWDFLDSSFPYLEMRLRRSL
jgi:hypothetical protein